MSQWPKMYTFRQNRQNAVKDDDSQHFVTHAIRMEINGRAWAVFLNPLGQLFYKSHIGVVLCIECCNKE
jgi:hypothetical protein